MGSICRTILTTIYILQIIQGKLNFHNPGQVHSINKQKIRTTNVYCFLGARGGVARLRHGSHEGTQTLSSNFHPGGFKFGVQIYPQRGSNLLFKFPGKKFNKQHYLWIFLGFFCIFCCLLNSIWCFLNSSNWGGGLFWSSNRRGEGDQNQSSNLPILRLVLP